MNAALLLPAAFSLVGVAIGAVGTLFAAYLATSTSREKARWDQLSALRQERKLFLLEYLRAAQNSHDFAAQMWNEQRAVRELPENARRFIEIDSELWLHSKKL